ncbi:PAS domain-containing protein [Halomonas flagellata]|uniref:PAS domain-containing protein n=1 Tax=Halomonas flagellata TaxID=2920385 RepID=UPI0034DF4054
MDSNDSQPLSPRVLREMARRRLGQGLTDVSSCTVKYTQSLVSELELHQEELRIQNEELQQARDRLEIAREIAQTRYRDLFERAPMGYLLLDTKGRIQEANRAANSLLAPGTDLVGHDPASFIRPFAERHFRHLSNAQPVPPPSRYRAARF